MEFDYPTTLDYFLTIPIQKCVTFINFSHLILVKNKGVKKCIHGLWNCCSNLFAKQNIYKSRNSEIYTYIILFF